MTRNRNRSKLLKLLSRRRISDLSVSSRVILLDTIQLLRLTNDNDIAKEAEEAIASIILATETERLSTLKTFMVWHDFNEK